jgi:NADPH2:quinone reductase
VRAVYLERFGSVSDLQVREVPAPSPGPDDVLVQIRAAAINPSDVKNVQGTFGQTTLPRVPGRDFAGIVVQGPPSLRDQLVWGAGGDLGLTRDGTHAQFLALPRDAVQPKPERLSLEEAAAAALPSLTAWAALVDLGQVTKDDVVVVTGAAGAVGSMAVQIAHWRGARVIGAIRDQSEQEVAARLPLAATIQTATHDLREGVLQATSGHGATLVLDTVGGPLFEPCLTSLAMDGRQVAIASTGTRRVSFDLIDFYHRRLRLFGLDTLALDATACARILAQVGQVFDAGALQAPPIAARLPLEEASHGYEMVEHPAGPGKIVLLPA